MKWKPIADYPCYEISDEGFVRRIDTQRILKLNTKQGKHPYKRVHLSNNGVSSYELVHRLVLEAFVGPCPDGMQTLHADNNPANNCLSNLSWGTPKRNHETIDRRGSRNGRARLTEAQVLAIRASSDTLQSLSDTYKVSKKYISNIRSGITWKHLLPTTHQCTVPV